MKPTPSATDIESLAVRLRTTQDEARRQLWREWRRESLFELSEELHLGPHTVSPAYVQGQLARLIRILYNSEE